MQRNFFVFFLNRFEVHIDDSLAEIRYCSTSMRMEMNGKSVIMRLKVKSYPLIPLMHSLNL